MEIYQEFIAAYDISENRRRKKLYDTLLDMGLVPIQKSVFWGRTTNAERKAIHRLFHQIMQKETDRAFIVKARLAENLKNDSFGYENNECFSKDRFKVL